MTENAAKTIDPAALSIADASRLLTKSAGIRVTESELRCDIEAGAPTNADGTINLVNFTAWMVREVLSGD